MFYAHHAPPTSFHVYCLGCHPYLDVYGGVLCPYGSPGSMTPDTGIASSTSKSISISPMFPFLWCASRCTCRASHRCCFPAGGICSSSLSMVIGHHECIVCRSHVRCALTRSVRVTAFSALSGLVMRLSANSYPAASPYR